MREQKPNIGVIAVGRSTFDTAYAGEVFETAWRSLQTLPVVLLGEKTLHYEAADAMQAFRALDAQKMDILVLLQVTFTDAAVCAEMAKSLKVPLVVWTFSEARTGGRLRLNSFCGVNLAAHALSLLGKKLDNLHGAADSQACLAGIYECAKAARVVKKLAASKILVVGEHPTGFDACRYDPTFVKEKFGVAIENTSTLDFIEQVKAEPDEIAQPAYARRAKDFPNLGEMNQEQTIKSLKVYATLKARAEAEKIDGIAVRCWPEFFTQYGCAACGAIGLLNEDKIPGGCEADFYGVLSSLVLQEASGEAAFNTDLVDIDEAGNTVVFWHCGQAPIEMADPDCQPRATIHTNRKMPLLAEFPLKPGRITLCRFTQGQGKLRLMIAGGEMQKAPLAFAGTSGVARMDVEATTFRERQLEAGMEHHASLVYGDHRPLLRKIARYLEIEVLELA